jgi:hypothetical protein
LRGCAARQGEALEEISDRDRSVRLVDGDARAVEEGFEEGLLTLVASGQVRTLDPLQDAAALVAGDPPQPRWEALPQLAAYVELLRLGYPEPAVRFATPADELHLDLAAVGEHGEVLVVGAARAESLLLSKLEALVPTFEGTGPRTVRSSLGCDAHRVATQLWATRAPYLWLVAAGARRVLRVTYGRTITLAPTRRLPRPEELWPYGFDAATPRVLLSGVEPGAVTG